MAASEGGAMLCPGEARDHRAQGTAALSLLDTRVFGKPPTSAGFQLPLDPSRRHTEEERKHWGGAWEQGESCNTLV